MLWWIVGGVLGLIAVLAVATWAATSVWVHIISNRWNAMCADDQPPVRPTAAEPPELARRAPYRPRR